MKKRWIVLVSALLVSIACSYAQKPAIVTGDENGWYRIGQVRASFDKETESIIVMGKDEFSSIKLRVTEAPVTIERIQVFFEGGKVQEADVKQPLQAGEETREINLYAENKEIDKVVFTYKTNANDRGKKAEVELFGFKSHRDGAGSSEQSVREDVKEGAEKAENAVEEGAEKVKDNVSEAASKASSAITDEVIEDKTGPSGQTIYADDNNNYYWVDEEGTRHYLSVLELKDKG